MRKKDSVCHLSTTFFDKNKDYSPECNNLGGKLTDVLQLFLFSSTHL